MPRQAKEYTIICTSARGSVREVKGTLTYLKQYFGFTTSREFSTGFYGNHKTVKIAEPRTISSLIRALDKMIEVQYPTCYYFPSYELKKSR